MSETVKLTEENKQQLREVFEKIDRLTDRYHTLMRELLPFLTEKSRREETGTEEIR